MFVCTNEDCGLIFDRPDLRDIPLEDGVSWRHEWWACCPNCGDTEYTDAERCEECGDWWKPWKLNDGVCPDCLREKMWKEIRIG